MKPATYAALGWRIFPCHSIERGRCTCNKGVSCQSPGKHPRTSHGVKDATSDVETIRRWETTWPGCNWALACGAASGVIVVDVDQRHGGITSFDEYEESRPDGPLPATLRTSTGGGGIHLIFAYPTSGEPVTNRVDWLPGVDVRSDGGYIILPPGTHISGARYSWTNWHEGMMPAAPPADFIKSLTMSNGQSKGDIGDAASILKGVPEGQRDDTLFRWACQLRRLLNDDRELVEHLVLEAARKSTPPFSKHEALRKVEQAFKQDHADDAESSTTHPLTDVGNKERFLDKFGEDLLHVTGWGWYKWTSTGWRSVADAHVGHMAEQVAKMVGREMLSITDTTVQKSYNAWWKQCQTAGRLKAIVQLASYDPRVRRPVDAFDSQPHLLACRNGVVDLTTGELRAIMREDLLTKNTKVTYDEYASSERWDKFLEEVTGKDYEMIEYLQKAAGYTLTGSTDEECFFLISGQPATGKSTFMDALHKCMGTYSTILQSDVLMERRNRDVPSNELARLVNLRFVSVSEVKERESFNLGLVKQITGGDTISARRLYQEGFEYKPQLKLWIATNHDPSHDGDQGLIRRIRKVPFPFVVPVDRRDASLKRYLISSDGSSAVLRWAVQGAVKWYTSGKLDEPQVIIDENKKYNIAHDRFGQFLEDVIEQGDGRNVLVIKSLYQQYESWCSLNGERQLSRGNFKLKMTERGYVHTGDSYIGIRLKPTTTVQLW